MTLGPSVTSNFTFNEKRAMSHVIHKYVLPLAEVMTLSLPGDCQFLHVDNQGDNLCLWVAVEIDQPKKPHEVMVLGTGHPVDIVNYLHLGTAKVGAFVWHVFLKLSFVPECTV